MGNRGFRKTGFYVRFLVIAWRILTHKSLPKSIGSSLKITSHDLNSNEFIESPVMHCTVCLCSYPWKDLNSIGASRKPRIHCGCQKFGRWLQDLKVIWIGYEVHFWRHYEPTLSVERFPVPYLVPPLDRFLLFLPASSSNSWEDGKGRNGRPKQKVTNTNPRKSLNLKVETS